MTLKDFENGEKIKWEGPTLISRKHDDTAKKLAEHELDDLRIGLKVFVNRDDPSFVLECTEKGKYL